MKLELLDLGQGALVAEHVRANPEKLFEDPTTLILAAASLNADVEVQGDHGRLTLSGSATDKALVEAADAAGLDRAALWRDYPRRLLRERDRGAHFVVSLHDAPDGDALAFLKGAPEQVVHLCERDAAGPLDEKARERLLARNEAMAAEGLRVLAVGWRRLERGQREGLERGHTLLGLLGLRDPLRPGAARIVRGAARAHIRTVILTGDQRRTAEAVASALGLQGEVLDGPELAALLRGSGPETHARLRKIAAVARIDPADKAAFVRALREAGEIVAMAGDGVNDAPAIRAADVGIAIGSRASDVSR